MRCTFAAGLLLAVSAHAAAAQAVTIRDRGPGVGPRILQGALDAPHRVIPPGRGTVILQRDSTYAATVIVLGRSAVVEGRVHGDVIVVGGSLFMHPGAQVDGRAVAIGSGAYRSLLALVHGGYFSFRDFTYDIQPVPGGYSLTYRALGAPPTPAIALAGLHGFSFPSYDRTDGLSLPFGAAISLDSSHVQVTPALTYRSQLGRLDPGVNGTLQANRHLRFDAVAGRSTFSNDTWIRSDLLNSAATLFLGTDTRNYYRADRGEVMAHYLVETASAEIEPLLGFRAERAWSVRPDSGEAGGPWSLFGHHARDGILRPNPRIDDGTITSALIGGRLGWRGQGGVALSANLVTEIAGASPVHHGFAQWTVDATAGFPTFGPQRFDIETHAVFTESDSTPRQRWAYLGGSATLPFLGLLSEGGDQLVYIDSKYAIPIDAISLPFVGAPTLALRDVIGGAGVGRLPSLEHNVGIRVSLSVVKFDAMFDPARRRLRFSTGLSMSR